MFKEIEVGSLSFNPFKRIGKDWCLITAGDQKSFNTMTASWGGVGVLWNKDVATCYIRPQRYTKEFIDSCDYFTLSFFPDGYKDALTLCGKVSGRDVDKPLKTGLKPVFSDNTVFFEQANLVIVCRKLYAQQMTETSFIDKDVFIKNYPNMDLHTMYVGEIVKVYTNQLI